MINVTKPPRSIVIFRALQLGDLMCTVPAFRALRAYYPQAAISLVGLPWASAFVERFSDYLDEFIPFPGWPGLPEQEVQVHSVPGFLSEMQARHFDLALQMQGDGSLTNALVLLFGAHQVSGFMRKGQEFTEPARFFPYPDGEHEIRIFLRLMRHLGIPSQGEQLIFPISAAERTAFEGFRQSYQPTLGAYICLHPGARDFKRRWNPEKFAAVGDRLAERGYQVVLTGTATEGALTSEVASHMQRPALDLAGKTDLATAALLVENARLLISNDTGVSHIAAAFHTPSVILFNTSELNRWRPLDQQLHRIIQNASQAAPDEVMNEADQLLLKERAYGN
jgi:ADP-heptose:LPS heptosyltransferase